MKNTLNLETVRETEYFKSLDDPFKLGLTLYIENTRKGNPTNLNYLAQVLADDLNKGRIESAFNALHAWGLVRGRFGETQKGRPGYIRELTSQGEYQFEQNYRELMKEIRKRQRHLREFKKDIEEARTKTNGELTVKLATPDKSGKSILGEIVDDMYKEHSLPPKK